MISRTIASLRKIPIHVYVAISGWLSRLIVAPVQLIAIPVFYQKLGLHDFAVFTVITGLIGWYAIMDFGIGSALQNYISEFRAKKKDPAILLVKTFPMVILALLFILLLLLIFGNIINHWLFSHVGSSLSSANFILVLTLYCWYFIFLIGMKIFFAYQRGFWGYFYQSLGYLILLVLIGVVYFSKSEITLATALYIWVLPLLGCGIISFMHAFWLGKAKFCNVSWDMSFNKQLGNRALQYWLVAICNNGVLAIDYFVIVKLLTAVDIVTYNVVYKIFVMMLFVYATVLSALWPTLAEHYARGSKIEFDHADKQIKKTIFYGILYILFVTILLICFKKEILHLFSLQQAISLPLSLLIMFGLYGCIRVWTDTFAVALQARNMTKIFLKITPIQAVIALILMLLLNRFGLDGILCALILSYVFTASILLPKQHYRYRA